jgi:hypothetical protein
MAYICPDCGRVHGTCTFCGHDNDCKKRLRREAAKPYIYEASVVEGQPTVVGIGRFKIRAATVVHKGVLVPCLSIEPMPVYEVAERAARKMNRGGR